MFNSNLKKKYVEDFSDQFNTPFNLSEIKNQISFVENSRTQKRSFLILSYLNLSFLLIISMFLLGRGFWLIYNYDYDPNNIISNDSKDIFYYFVLGGFLLILFLTNLIFFFRKKDYRT